MSDQTAAAPRRYLLCGLSARGVASFAFPLLGLTDPRGEGADFGTDVEDLSAHATLIGAVDTDQARVDEFNERLVAQGRAPVAYIAPDAYVEALRRLQPDGVIVASPDHTHESYIVPALAAGVEVVSEKPVVTSVAAGLRILAEQRRTGARLQVAHNFRYPAAHREVRRLIQEGTIGDVVRVVMDYHLDKRHGSSFFLRWNRMASASGGLPIHKSCHHFDLLNWWIGSRPIELFGYGARNFYGADSPHRPSGDLIEDDPYGSAAVVGESGARVGLFDLHYALQYPAERRLTLYDDDIEIDDTYAAVIRYDNGAMVTYSIDFSSTWEGYRVMIAGTHGTIELRHGRNGDGTPIEDGDVVVVSELFGGSRRIDVAVEAGGHGGADPLMRQDIFVGPSPQSELLGLLATPEQAVTAVAMGEGLIRSVAEHRPVDLRNVLDG